VQPFPQAPQQRSGERAARVTVTLVVAGLLGLLALPGPRERPLSRTDAWNAHVALTGFREAIGAYRMDHGRFPGWEPCDPADGPAAGAAWLEGQLCRPTNELGEPAPGLEPEAAYPFGPYIGGGLPANPVTGLSTVRVLDPGAPASVQADGSAGWLYDPRDGRLWLDLPGRLRAQDVGYFGR
jgi:hypothetical protein